MILLFESLGYCILCVTREWSALDSEARLLDGEPDPLGDACAVLRVDLVEVGEDALLNVPTALTEATRDVVHDFLAHGVVEDVAEEGTRLLVVRVRVLVSVAASLANHLLWSPGVSLVLDGCARD